MSRHGAKFKLSKKSEGERLAMLERFVTRFEDYLRGGSDAPSRSQIMDEVGVDARQLDNFLREAFNQNYVQVRHRTLPSLAEKIQGGWGHKLDQLTIVTGSDERRHARAAAEVFVRQLLTIGERKGSDEFVTVGVISGRTSGSVMHAATELNWSEDLGRLSAEKLPNVRVLALNVTPVGPGRLEGNANILVYEFTRKIRQEFARNPGTDRRVDAYGLMAPLIVEMSELAQTDESPQTFDVVKFSEPYRVRDRIEQGLGSGRIHRVATELDLVLTGVGVPKPGSGSLLYDLAQEFGERLGLDLDDFVSHNQITGDINFVPFQRDGTPMDLEAADGKRYRFYSTLHPDILAEMVQRKKSVILVARRDEGKHEAIYSAIGARDRPFASHVVIDEATGRALARLADP